MSSPNLDVIAVLPAAGAGSRLGQIPCSKELVPMQRGPVDPFRPAHGGRVIIEEALYGLGANGISAAVIVTAPGKDDIEARLGSGPVGGVHLTYLGRADSPSVPHTVQTALATAGGRNVLLWFPDILVKPVSLVRELMEAHRKSGADVTLALVPSHRGDKVDIISLDDCGEIEAISAKPGPGIHGWTWVTAIWTARFSAFLDHYVRSSGGPSGREWQMADVLNAGRNGKFIVRSLKFSDGKALDVGTPDDLDRLWAGGGPEPVL